MTKSRGFPPQDIGMFLTAFSLFNILLIINIIFGIKLAKNEIHFNKQHHNFKKFSNKIIKKLILALLLFINSIDLIAQQPIPIEPRILVSTDIGGTDPDDNQSMAHLLMYSEKFNIEGLVSSPSYGKGSKKEILRKIDLYEKDLPKLQKHKKGFPAPNYLRSITNFEKALYNSLLFKSLFFSKKQIEF